MLAIIIILDVTDSFNVLGFLLVGGTQGTFSAEEPLLY